MDEADIPALAGFKWRIQRRPLGVSYCVAWGDEAKTKLVFMHRLLLNAPVDREVDHANGDGLDNRRVNIRLATRAQNAKNLPARKSGSSPFKGVSVRRRKKIRFVVQIKQDGECLKIGTFDSEHRAAKAYDAAARLFHGKFARTNAMLGLYDKHPDRTVADVHLL